MQCFSTDLWCSLGPYVQLRSFNGIKAGWPHVDTRGGFTDSGIKRAIITGLNSACTSVSCLYRHTDVVRLQYMYATHSVVYFGERVVCFNVVVVVVYQQEATSRGEKQSQHTLGAINCIFIDSHLELPTWGLKRPIIKCWNDVNKPLNLVQ